MAVIGFDIGGTKCAVCVGNVVGDRLEITGKRIIPTEHSDTPYEVLEKLCRLTEEMTDDFSLIGISCGGPLDSEKGIIMSPPNLPGWDNIKICDFLRKRYGAEVYIENDANACAAAEWRFGAGRGCDNMIFMTFGTGLGAGLILNGQLYRGANNMAGEAGHIRLSKFGPVGYGKAGSFEGFCSGGGIAQLAKTYAMEKIQLGKEVSFCSDISKLDLVTAKSVAEYANNGECDALEVYEICGRMLGHGLSILIDILNPERIVLGSIFNRAEKLLRASMQETLERECLEASLSVCRILPAELEESIGDYAAFSAALINKRS